MQRMSTEDADIERTQMPNRQDLIRNSGSPIYVPPIQVNKSIFPYCVVWSPLPPITWILPFIGHMGIADSRGIIHDFAGPYYIGVGNFAFGAPTRYMVLQPDQCYAATWDEGVDSGCQEYTKHMHNICCDNCHSHVARCLNDMKFNNVTTWNMINLGVKMFFFGKFTNLWGFVKTFLPFAIVLFITLYFTGQL